MDRNTQRQNAESGSQPDREKVTDFVYVYAKGPAVWNEIYYSIESIIKYFDGFFRVFIYGDWPGDEIMDLYTGSKKFTEIIWQETDRITGVKFAPIVDTNTKNTQMAWNHYINDEFVYMYDDIVFLRPFSVKDIRPVTAIQYESKQKIDGLVEKRNKPYAPKVKWEDLLIKTLLKLHEEGLPTFNYETHLPEMFSRKRLKEIIKKYDIPNNTYLISSLYYNNFYSCPERSLKSKNGKNLKAGFYHPEPPRNVDRKMEGKLCVNYNDYGLTDHLKKKILRNLYGKKKRAGV